MTSPLSGTERGTGGEDPNSDLPTNRGRREGRETAAVPEVQPHGERDEGAHGDPADDAAGGHSV